MAQARLIVCERSGAWADRLRRELAGRNVALAETRTPREARAALSQSPSACLVLELVPGGAEEALDLLIDLPRGYPHVRAAVVADRQLADYEGLVRELGAVAFASSPRGLALLADTLARQLAAMPAAASGLTEGLLDALPWN
jgi:hypothetical protein